MHMEMEKQCLKNIYWATQRQWHPEKNLNKQTLLGCPLSTQLVHTIVIYGGGSLEQVLCLHSSGSLGEAMGLPESLGLDCFQLEIIHIQRDTLGWQTLLLYTMFPSSERHLVGEGRIGSLGSADASYYI